MIEMRFQLKQVVMVRGREGRVVSRKLIEVEAFFNDTATTEIYTVKVPGPTEEIHEVEGRFLQPVSGGLAACKEEIALAEAIDRRPIILSTDGLLSLMVKNICDAVAVGYDWRLVI
jgi:hypothetical protein